MKRKKRKDEMKINSSLRSLFSSILELLERMREMMAVRRNDRRIAEHENSNLPRYQRRDEKRIMERALETE